MIVSTALTAAERPVPVRATPTPRPCVVVVLEGQQVFPDQDRCEGAGFDVVVLPGGRPVAQQLHERPGLIADREVVWLPTVGVTTSVADADRLFAAHRTHGFSLGAPSLAAGSVSPHSLLLHHSGFALRETNFVERTAPVWTAAVLRAFLPALSSLEVSQDPEAGWANLLTTLPTTTAVYDAATVQAPGAASDLARPLPGHHQQHPGASCSAMLGPEAPAVLSGLDEHGAVVVPTQLLARLVDGLPEGTLAPSPGCAHCGDAHAGLVGRAAARRQVAEARRRDVRARVERRPWRSRARRNLVVLRAGATSLHSAWYTPDRQFDIVVDAHGPHPEQYRDTCDLLFSGLGDTGCLAQHSLFEENPHLLRDYDAFWFPDDDIEASTAQVNALFQLHAEAGFDLAQPALSVDSYFTCSFTVQHQAISVRETNFVESMVPLFTQEALAVCLPTLAQTRSGWGLEVAWQSLLQTIGCRTAIYDCLPVRHTRPAGLHGPQGSDEASARAEFAAMAAQYDCPDVDRRLVLAAWDSTFRRIPPEALGAAMVSGFPATSVQPPHGWDKYAASVAAQRDVSRSRTLSRRSVWSCGSREAGEGQERVPDLLDVHLQDAVGHLFG